MFPLQLLLFNNWTHAINFSVRDGAKKIATAYNVKHFYAKMKQVCKVFILLICIQGDSSSMYNIPGSGYWHCYDKKVIVIICPILCSFPNKYDSYSRN